MIELLIGGLGIVLVLVAFSLLVAIALDKWP